MERRAILALVLVGLAGCKQILGLEDPTVAPDAEPATDDGYLSGTRLKLKWNDYGGTRQFVNVYDAELDEICVPTAWADGKSYCMPRGGGVGYADAACTQPLGLRLHGLGLCNPPPRYFASSETQACNEVRRTRLFRGGPAAQLVPFYTKSSTGGCNGPNLSTNYDQFPITEMPTTEMVELALTTQTMGRLQQRGFRGSDGTRLPFDIYDTTLDTSCSISSNGTCAPAGVSPGGFEDPGCSQPTGAALTGCANPKYGARARRPGCPDPSLDYFSFGAALASSTLYQRDSASACVSYTATPGYTYYRQGPPVLPATLARSVDTEPGRQIQRVYFADATARFRSGLLFDTAHGVDCTTLGGRCLPSDGSVQTYFSSPLCSGSVDVATVFSGPAMCGVPPAPRYAIKSIAASGSCDTTYDVYAVGAQHVGTLYQQTGGTCVPVTIGNGVAFDIGMMLPASEFASATAVTDP